MTTLIAFSVNRCRRETAHTRVGKTRVRTRVCSPSMRPARVSQARGYRVARARFPTRCSLFRASLCKGSTHAQPRARSLRRAARGRSHALAHLEHGRRGRTHEAAGRAATRGRGHRCRQACPGARTACATEHVHRTAAPPACIGGHHRGGVARRSGACAANGAAPQRRRLCHCRRSGIHLPRCAVLCTHSGVQSGHAGVACVYWPAGKRGRCGVREGARVDTGLCVTLGLLWAQAPQRVRRPCRAARRVRWLAAACAAVVARAIAASGRRAGVETASYRLSLFPDSRRPPSHSPSHGDTTHT